MSQAKFSRSLKRDLLELERKVQKLEKSPPTPPLPFQTLPDGRPFFQGGFVLGGGTFYEMYEPETIPAPTGLVLSWGASFETIYIDASWAEPTSRAASVIAGYTVQALKEGSLFPIEVSVMSGARNVRIEPVEPNSTYTVRVFALSRNNRNGLVLEGTITTGGDTTPPAPPTFPANAVQVGIESLSVRWNSNTERDVANGAGQYRLIVSTNQNLSSPTYDQRVSSSQQFVAPLTANKPYWVGLAAIDSSGNESTVAMAPGGPWTPKAVVAEEVAFAAGGGNLVRDSGFESGGYASDRWRIAVGAWTINGTEGRVGFGAKAAKVSGTSDAQIYQDIPIGPGDWVLSCYSKAQNVARAPGSTAAGVTLSWELASGAPPTGFTALMGGTLEGNMLVRGRGSWDWDRMALRFTVPAGGCVLRVVLQRGLGGDCTGTAWFDDVQLENSRVISAYAPRPNELLPGTVTSTILADDSVTTPKLVANSVVAGKVAADTIGAREVVAQSLTGDEMALRTLNAQHVQVAGLTGNEIAAGSVHGDRITAGTLAANRITAGSITTDRLAATLALIVGQLVQSANYVSGSSGWRIDGAGNAEFNAATVRGSTWIGGVINIAGRIFASPADPAVHLAANVDIGANNSGTIYSGDPNWGFQIGSRLGEVWTHQRSWLGTTANEIGWYDTFRGVRVMYMRGVNYDLVLPGPYGRVISAKRNQVGGLSGAAFIAEASGVLSGSSGTEATICLHVPENGVATVLKTFGPLGPALEVRDAGDNVFVPVKASQFLVSSAEDTKTDIVPMPEDAGDAITELQPVKFGRVRVECSLCQGTGKVVNEAGEARMGKACPVCKGKKGSPNIPQADETYGLIAHEVAAVLPEAVTYDGEKPDAIDLNSLNAVMLRKLQQVIGRLEAVEQSVDALASER